ncbi:MAG: hypothetical protein LW878_05825 [Proteobacteria bacterium]|nr:hypothetical protein [Pseudomonadota bacterium]
MKKLLAFVLLMVIALPALAQIRRPVPMPPPFPPRGPSYPYPGPGYPYPGPGYPYPGPTPLPPSYYCTGTRYDAVLEATEMAAKEKLESFAMEKGVECTLTSSGFDFARGECTQVTGEPFARLKMSFNTNCETRTPTSRLRKTTITYIRN